MKQFLSLILAILCSTSIALADTYTGTTGDCTYTLDTDEGTLVISGSGAMADYSSSSSVPWYSYRSYVKTVTIEDGVTSIGNDAFYYCTSLTSVTIGSGVTYIGDYAFYRCSSLTSITIPDAVTYVGSFAFYNCSSLTSITIPDGVTSIGSHAFYDCTSLTSINIPDGVTSIGSYAFYYCTSLTSITIPDGVTSIMWEAFYYCSSLTSIIIPDAVTYIDYQAFYNCYNLTSVTIGSGVTSISDYAFYDCTNVTTVTSYDTTPPTVSENTFNSSTYSSAILNVTSTSYVLADYWKQFSTKTIVDASEEEDYSVYDIFSDDDAGDDNTAVNIATASTSAIRTAGSAIVITTETAQTAQVYSLSGQLLVKQAVAAGETSIGMPTGGVYIVALADGTKAKVLVK